MPPLFKKIFKPSISIVPIFQDEGSDCGYACISMIANYFGRNVTINELKHSFQSGGRGLSLLDLKTITQGVGLNCEAFKVDKEVLNINSPAIIHWDWKHFVVLDRIKKNKIVIVDPALGKITVDKETFQQKATGFILEFPNNKREPPLKSKTLKLNSVLEKVFIKKAFVRMLVLAFLSQLFILVAPLFSKLIFDEVIQYKDIGYLSLISLSFLVIAVFMQVSNFLRHLLDSNIAARLSRALSLDFIDRLLQKHNYFFERRSSINILNKFRSLRAIQDFLLTQSISLFTNVFKAIFAGILLLVISHEIALLTLMFFLTSLIIRRYFNNKIFEYSSNSYSNKVEIEAQLTEIVTSIQAIKLFEANKKVKERFTDKINNHYKNKITLEKYFAADSTTNSLFESIERIIILFIGAYFIIIGNLTVGGLIAGIMYKEFLVASLNELLQAYFEYNRLNVYLNRLEDIYSFDEEDKFASNNSNNHKLVGNISVKNLSFSYGFNEKFLFENLSFEIKAGTSVALTGASGVGKTTILKILSGLSSPNAGEVTIDGYNLLSSENNWIKKEIGSVMQEDKLLTASIAENITFFNDDITMEQIYHAAKVVNIHDEILAFPMGYNTILNNESNHISSGQIQRILIARAIVRNPKILIMDEATSNIDIDNEILIAENLSKLDMTKVIVAHRPHTIQSCNTVINIENLIKGV